MTAARQDRHKARSRDPRPGLAELVRRMEERAPARLSPAVVPTEDALARWERWDLGAWLVWGATLSHSLGREQARLRARAVEQLARREAARMNLQTGELAATVEKARELARMLDPGPEPPLKPVMVVAAGPLIRPEVLYPARYR